MITQRLLCKRPDGRVSMVMPPANPEKAIQAVQAHMLSTLLRAATVRRDVVMIPSEGKEPTPTEVVIFILDGIERDADAWNAFLDAELGKIATADDAWSYIKAKDTPADATAVVECDAADLPPKERHRDAWDIDGGQFKVDMARALAIAQDRIRAVRKPILEKYDVVVSRALTAKDDAAVVAAEAKRKTLRDATADSRLAAAATDADLWAAERTIAAEIVSI